jgi:hypothetical protein
MEPLPSIPKSFAIVQQQERKINPNGKILSSAAQPVIAAASWKPGSTNTGKGSRGKSQYNRGSSSAGKICNFCGRPNHIVETCYFKHGFPSNFKFKYRGPNNSSNTEHASNSVNTANATSHTSSPSNLSSDDMKMLIDMLDKARVQNTHTVNQLTSHINSVESNQGLSLMNSLWISCLQ